MTREFNSPFIAIEGPIGVGKTSLSTMIANHFSYALLKEIVDENPFLTKFYQDPEAWSFQTEMFFLCNRFKQLEDIYSDYLMSGKPVVSDYHIFKNLLFAKQTLTNDHYLKYERIYSIIINDLPKPNVIIYLRASLPTLLNRIQLRGRDMEKSIDPSYLRDLSEHYDIFIQEQKRVYPHIPILTFDADQLDFVNKKEDYTYIIEEITKALKIKRGLF